MPNFPVEKLIPACSTWLAAGVETRIPAINAALASAIRGTSTATQFASTCYIGDLPNASEIRFCVDAASGDPYDPAASMGLSMNSTTYRIMALIPVAGDLTAMNYEVVKQITLGHVISWLDNDVISLSPTVTIADEPDASAKAYKCTRGSWMTYLGTRMADGITSNRGWTMFVTMQFNVAGGMVLDA